MYASIQIINLAMFLCTLGHSPLYIGIKLCIGCPMIHVCMLKWIAHLVKSGKTVLQML